jgi:peptide chain release factor 2
LRNESRSFGGLFDVDRKRDDIKELESRITAPGFWDDNEAAQKLLRERTSMEKEVELCDRLASLYEDALVMVELGEDAQDEEALAEVHQMVDRLHDLVEGAEFQRMLSGPHDRSNCYLSINAGAGGTESQD